ncbi:alpha/beta fold hydrolase [Ornithinimicrobium sp. W1665]|uniref:alpha/beta fold hydrolase n=1 Tax=Ornithinimicrobium sp. W1665 TaxID=3416666 RepID=UPI003CF85804
MTESQPEPRPEFQPESGPDIQPEPDAPATPLVLLHGVGQAPMAWEDLVVRLYGSRRLLTPWVPGLRPTETRPVPVEEAADRLAQEIELEGLGRVDLCAQSWGSMVATRLAAEHPDRVRRLVLIGGQVRTPKLVSGVQAGLLRLMPASRLADAGVSKDRLTAMLDVARRTDLTDALPRITAATLVLVGDRDRAGQLGARSLADGIAGARLRVVQGAGPSLNEERPEELEHLLRDFLDRD